MRNVRHFFEIIFIGALAILIFPLSAAVAAVGSFLIVGSVAGTYIIRRYEMENVPALTAPRFGKATPLERVMAMAGEAAAAFACAVLYPFGYLFGDPSRTRFRRGGHPVILCHGYMENRSSLFWLGWRLRKAGWRNVIIPNFRPSSASIPKFAEALSEVVSLALKRADARKVDLVGHSMGGLVVRYYIECLGGAEFVHSAVTIGTPHRGTKTAVLGLFGTAAQFRQDSPFVKQLCEAAPACGVNMVSIWSEFDNIVLPPENALLPEPYKNLMVKNLGHVALLFSGQVLNMVRLALSNNENT
jgi:triacylglycerol esterase/lipase EstA (alpha/beta hydrolase family)